VTDLNSINAWVFIKAMHQLIRNRRTFRCPLGHIGLEPLEFGYKAGQAVLSTVFPIMSRPSCSCSEGQPHIPPDNSIMTLLDCGTLDQQGRARRAWQMFSLSPTNSQCPETTRFERAA
jgi:hypothetical protein